MPIADDFAHPIYLKSIVSGIKSVLPVFQLTILSLKLVIELEDVNEWHWMNDRQKKVPLYAVGLSPLSDYCMIPSQSVFPSCSIRHCSYFAIIYNLPDIWTDRWVD